VAGCRPPVDGVEVMSKVFLGSTTPKDLDLGQPLGTLLRRG
jgi:hypothetical protein